MKYYLAHNGVDVFNYDKIEDNQEIQTGQPILKYFNSIEELEAELAIYGIGLTERIDSNDDANPDDEPGLASVTI